jgi:hypothetical protein
MGVDIETDVGLSLQQTNSVVAYIAGWDKLVMGGDYGGAHSEIGSSALLYRRTTSTSLTPRSLQKG